MRNAGLKNAARECRHDRVGHSKGIRTLGSGAVQVLRRQPHASGTSFATAGFQIGSAGEEWMMLQVRTLLLALALEAACIPNSGTQSRPATGGSADVRWQTYIDPGHGTAVEFPAGIFTVDAGAPERGSGRAFRTRDGRARLVVYTLPNQERHSPQEYLHRHLVIFPGNLDYSRVT